MRRDAAGIELRSVGEVMLVDDAVLIAQRDGEAVFRRQPRLREGARCAAQNGGAGEQTKAASESRHDKSPSLLTAEFARAERARDAHRIKISEVAVRPFDRRRKRRE